VSAPLARASVPMKGSTPSMLRAGGDSSVAGFDAAEWVVDGRPTVHGGTLSGSDALRVA
jgi:hypothetical protein